jgi:hypothetical protein
MPKMRRFPENKRDGGRLVATAAVIAGLMMSGCGGESEQAPVSAQGQAAELPPTHTGNPSLDSINGFRRRILTAHRAKIFLNTCVAWPSESGMTVTYNPGVASLKVGSKQEQYYVFEATDSRTATGVIEMNGLGIRDPNALPVIMPRPVADKGAPEGMRDIKLSSKPVTDKNDQLAYLDTATGQPVLDTAIVAVPPNPSIAINDCKDLRDHLPIPGVVAQP